MSVLNHERAIEPLVQPQVEVRRGLADLRIGQLLEKIFHGREFGWFSGFGKPRLKFFSGATDPHLAGRNRDLENRCQFLVFIGFGVFQEQ